ncbi:MULTISPECIES: hypothetical protein [Chitinophagaceae]
MANSNIHNDNVPLDDEWMSRLVEGRLSKEEEDMLSANTEYSALFADAVEGLEQFKSIHTAQKQAHDINRQLLEQLKSKSSKKTLQPLPMSTIVWIALIFILVLVVLGYYLIRIKGL